MNTFLLFSAILNDIEICIYIYTLYVLLIS